MKLYEMACESAGYIKSVISGDIDAAVVLGSGLGVLADGFEDKVEIPYTDIPNFPVSTVPGHAGLLIYGKLGGKRVLAMNGRFHCYEGYGMDEVTFAVRVIGVLGVKKLILTNAAGGINTAYNPGDLMLICDHIKLTGESPLRGGNDDRFGTRFPDMSCAYSKRMRTDARLAAQDLGIALREGVYFYMTGPSFETPAEIRALRILGADAVGMSTVPEVIAANHMGMEVLGISCISNMAAGILPKPLTHEEVMETGELVRDKFVRLLGGIIERI